MIPNAHFCRLVWDRATGSAKFEDQVQQPSEFLPHLIEYDKAFGKYDLPDGTASYRIYSDPPRGLDRLQLMQAVEHGLKRLFMYSKAMKRIKYAPNDSNAAFKIYCRTVSEDPNLTRNTIMYAYYPLRSDVKGVVVVNRDGFYYTPHGNSISMFKIAPEHYPEDTKSTGATIDIDQVFGHEFLHSFGIPHDPKQGNIMSSNYSVMSEYMTQRDSARLAAKYGARNVGSGFLKGFLGRLKIYSDK